MISLGVDHDLAGGLDGDVLVAGDLDRPSGSRARSPPRRVGTCPCPPLSSTLNTFSLPRVSRKTSSLPSQGLHREVLLGRRCPAGPAACTSRSRARRARPGDVGHRVRSRRGPRRSSGMRLHASSASGTDADTRAQALSSVSFSVGYFTLTRPSFSVSLLLVTTPIDQTAVGPSAGRSGPLGHRRRRGGRRGVRGRNLRTRTGTRTARRPATTWVSRCTRTTRWRAPTPTTSSTAPGTGARDHRCTRPWPRPSRRRPAGTDRPRSPRLRWRCTRRRLAPEPATTDRDPSLAGVLGHRGPYEQTGVLDGAGTDDGLLRLRIPPLDLDLRRAFGQRRPGPERRRSSPHVITHPDSVTGVTKWTVSSSTYHRAPRCAGAFGEERVVRAALEQVVVRRPEDVDLGLGAGGRRRSWTRRPGRSP